MTERAKSLKLRAMTTAHAAQIPLLLKLLHTLLVGVVVVVYAIKYKPTNFLWFSDIALLTSVLAMWLENALLASTMAVAVLLPELAWNLDFFTRLLVGWRIVGLSDYMFESRRPLYLRSLSLFHVALPILLLWLVHRLGYDRRALLAQTALAWVVLIATYLLSKPADNINWVFGPGSRPQHRLPPLVYLALVMIFFPTVVYLPTHWLLSKLFIKV
jgi:hypothetical protein